MSAAASVMPLAVFGSTVAFVLPMPEAMLAVWVMFRVMLMLHVMLLCVLQVCSLFW